MVEMVKTVAAEVNAKTLKAKTIEDGKDIFFSSIRAIPLDSTRCHHVTHTQQGQEYHNTAHSKSGTSALPHVNQYSSAGRSK